MTRRKDGRWADYLIGNDGKRKWFYGSTKAEVRRKMAAYNDSVECSTLFSAVADAWWEDAEPRLAYNTAKSYKPALARAKVRFGAAQIADIQPAEIQQFIAAFAADGKGHADKTVRTQLLVINLICKYAVQQGHMLLNPCRECQVPAGLSKTKVHAPSQHDIDIIKASYADPFGRLAYWALYTGLRCGELLALTWDDVDLATRRISVTKSVYHQGNAPHVKGTKTAASTGSVPILDALFRHLLGRTGTGLVFPGKRGGLMTKHELQDGWEAFRDASGLSSSLHQYRHAYATMLYEASVAPEDMQALLRHAQLATTMDVYRDIRDTKRDKIFESVWAVDIG